MKSTGDWAYLIFVILGVSIGSLALAAGGFYLLLRVLGGRLDARRPAWESSASKVGAVVDRTASGTYKPFKGERDGITFSVSYYSVPRGKNSFDDHVQVEAILRSPLELTLSLSKAENLFQSAARYLEAGLPIGGGRSLETEFVVECSDAPALSELLHADITQAESTSLFVDLLKAKNDFHRLKLTDTNVTLGLKADLGDAEQIATAIKRTVHLANRVESARSSSIGQGSISAPV